MRWILLTLALFLSLPAKSEAQSLQPAELEGLLAPVALQPDAVLWNVLEAATTPQQVLDAAASDAPDGPWSPAVKALLPYPELLDRMAESPQWLFDLGNAYIGQRNDVLAAVQALRQRAYGNGTLQSDPVQVVQHYGTAIAVVPAIPNYFAVRYYNPVVVYGPAWRPVRYVSWRPWAGRPVHAYKAKPKPMNGTPSPAARMQQRQAVQFRQYHRIPEAQRKPIVQQHYPRANAQYRGKRH